MNADPTQSNLSSPLILLVTAIPALLVLSVISGGWLIVQRINGQSASSSEAEPAEVESPGAAVSANLVSLTEGKLAAGGIESTAALSQAVQHLHTVPGRIRYDATKHVDVKAPIDGILMEVLVTPGEQVRSGQLLALLWGPDIGRARAEILKRQNQREIAQQLFDREQTLSRNLAGLSKMLDLRQSIESIESVFKNKSLGSHRQELLAAYAKMLLSTELLEKVQPLAESGSISGRSIREREAARQIAEAAFTSARDQVAFTALQTYARAEAEVAEADRQVNLAWQSVESLLGCKVLKDSSQFNDEESLSRLEIRAPLAGTVESRVIASNERVSRGDSLFILANTDSLYVEASLRESDWSAVALQRGTRVSVTVPALDDSVFDATLHYIGREVDPDTNSVPLVATIANGQGLLRPGMFVRVEIPIGQPRESLSVSSDSVVQHEDQQFVFVDMSGGTYQRVDVSTGISSDDWVEVTDGLSLGQLVVTHGSFLLKSELLLQGEDE